MKKSSKIAVILGIFLCFLTLPYGYKAYGENNPLKLWDASIKLLVNNQAEEDDLIELIDEEITDIEIGIVSSNNGSIAVVPVTDSITLNKGQKITLGVQLPEDASEKEPIVKVKNTGIAKFDNDFYTLEGLKEGNTTISFKTKNYGKDIKIIVKNP